MLRQVLTNLIGNALKFSRHTPEPLVEIAAGARTAGRSILCAINGVGFDMKYASKLFKVFQRLHNPETFEGTGVGLPSFIAWSSAMAVTCGPRAGPARALPSSSAGKEKASLRRLASGREARRRRRLRDIRPAELRRFPDGLPGPVSQLLRSKADFFGRRKSGKERTD